MTDLLDKNIRPELDEICEYVKNPLFATMVTAQQRGIISPLHSGPNLSYNGREPDWRCLA